MGPGGKNGLICDQSRELGLKSSYGAREGGGGDDGVLVCRRKKTRRTRPVSITSLPALRGKAAMLEDEAWRGRMLREDSGQRREPMMTAVMADWSGRSLWARGRGWRWRCGRDLQRCHGGVGGIYRGRAGL